MQSGRQSLRRRDREDLIHSLGAALSQMERALAAREILPVRLQAFRNLTLTFAPHMATLDKETRVRLENNVDAFDASTIPELGRLQPVDLAAWLNNHWKLRLQPSEQWMDAWFRASSAIMHNFDERDASTALYSLAMLRIKPPEDWMQKWLSHTRPLLARCGDHAFCNIAYAAAGQSLEGVMIPSDFRQALARQLMVRVTEQPGPIGQYHAAATLLDLPQPEWLRRAAPKLAEHFQPARRRSSLESGFANLIQPHLTQLQDCVNPRWEKWCSYTHSPLDLVLYYTPTEAGERHANLYVQLDGIGHFVKDPLGAPVLDGKSTIQSAVLEKHLGPHERLMRISGRDFAANPDREVNQVIDTLMQLSNRRTPPVSVESPSHEGTLRASNHMRR